MLQDNLALLQADIHTSDELVITETKELKKRIAILTQKNDRLSVDNHELMQLLKEAKEESNKFEATAKSYVARLTQARTNNLRRAESRISVASERRVMMMNVADAENARGGMPPMRGREENVDNGQGNAPLAQADDADVQPQLAPTVAPVLQPPNAHQLMKSVDWPKRSSCFQHDEYCKTVTETFARYLAKGIPEDMLAESLHSNISKQDRIGKLYTSELENNATITMTTVMETLKRCDREWSEKTNNQKWNSITKQPDESMYSFCRRVKTAYDNYNVGEGGNELQKEKLIKERVIKGADLPEDVALTAFMCTDIERLPSYIQTVMDNRKLQTPMRTTSQLPKWRQQSQQQQSFAQQQSVPQQPQQQYQRPQMQNPSQQYQQQRARQQQPRGRPPYQQMQYQYQPPPPYQQFPGQQQTHMRQQAQRQQPLPALLQQVRHPPPPRQAPQFPPRQQMQYQTAPKQYQNQALRVEQQQQTLTAQQQPHQTQEQQHQQPSMEQLEKSVATIQITTDFSERAPTDFEKRPENHQIEVCTRCRRIQSGHRSINCTFPAFCSMCQYEGHTDREHYKHIMALQQQQSMLQRRPLLPPSPLAGAQAMASDAVASNNQI